MQIDLYSGPPWGFRITHDQELRPVIVQLIPGGRADVAGLKIGDLIRKIGIISVGTCQEAHSLVHATSGKLTLVIERIPSKYHETVRREKLSTSVQNSPRNDPRAPISSVPNSPRQIRMDMMTGAKNSTDMKRRLFEDLAEDNSPSMVDHLLKKKIEMGEKTSAPSSIGYDSVAPDFAGSRRSSRRSTSSSSSQESKIVLEEDEVTILENFEGGGERAEMQPQQDIYNQNVLSHPGTNQWSVRTQHNNNIMPAQGDIEVPERRGVAALRQVINDRLEMKTPVGGASASRPKTPQYHQLPPQPQPPQQQPAWAANVKVYEPNGFHDPHANKHNMGRVLDGPADPTKYFQGVPPPSFSLTGVKSTPPPPTHAKPPAPRTSTTIRLPPDMSQHNFRPTTFMDNSHDDLDDGASMISSCISTFGESSEVAALSAAGSQRYLYDQYRRGLLNEKSNVIPEEMSTSITSTKSEITAPSSLFNTDIQLTPFGQSDKPRGRSSSMDLESSELLIKSKSPAPYTSQTADHFGTIRRRHTPVKMDVPTTPTPTSTEVSAPAPVEQRNYDSGYEGSNAISPEQTLLDKALSEAFELASSLSSSINLPNESFMTPSSSSLNNERPESFISSSSSHSHTPRPSQQNNVVVVSSPPPSSLPSNISPASLADPSLGGGSSSMPKRHEPEMSQWYRQMFKQMHKPGTEINENPSSTTTMRGEHLDLATISQGRVTPQKVEVDIEPRRARSVGRVIEPEANDFQQKTKNRFALERSKTAHFHLPSYKFQHEDPRPIRCSLRKCEGFPCMMCGRPRKDPSFEDVDRVYMELEKSRFREEKRVQKRMELRQVTDRLDETTRELDMFIESLQRTWQRSKSQPAMRLTTLTTKSSPSNLAAEIEDLKRISREEVLLRQKAEKLTDELQKEKERRHAYIPSSAAPSLHSNMDRFEGLVNNYSSSRAPQTQHPQHSTTTATVIYRFDGRSNRELSLNKGDIVRIIREVDSHWLEGERNGRMGIFPASYVQIESEYDRSRQKMRAIYPFTSRNSNELSLKKGEIVTFRREIDQNWMEGTNQIGTIGIFPSSYVRLLSEPKEETVIPDRPKTPKINHDEMPNQQPHKVRFEEPRIHQYQQHPHQEDEYRRPQPHQEDYRRPQPQPQPQPQQHQQKYEPVPVVEKEVRKPEPVAVVEKPRSDIRNNAAAVIPKGSEMYRAAFAYRPQKEDELELFVNDIIFVVEKCDDGWFIGTSLRTGDFGIFPGNYVQRH